MSADVALRNTAGVDGTKERVLFGCNKKGGQLTLPAFFVCKTAIFCYDRIYRLPRNWGALKFTRKFKARVAQVVRAQS